MKHMELVDAATYSVFVIGSQLTRSLDENLDGALSSNITPARRTRASEYRGEKARACPTKASVEISVGGIKESISYPPTKEEENAITFATRMKAGLSHNLVF